MKRKKRNQEWVELQEEKAAFQEIIRLLVEFDERTKRYQKLANPEVHYMRRAITLSDPEMLRIFIRDMGGFIYFVVTRLQSPGGEVITGWVHEDGIRVERDEFIDRKSHPVHKIVCLTDLYEKNSKSLPPDLKGQCIDDATIRFLTEEYNKIEFEDF